MSAPASLAKRVALQSGYETMSMLRNGEQLILAIVLPLLALIGLVVTPLLDSLVLEGAGDSRINIATPGVLALCAMSTAFTGQGIATGFDRRYGVLRFLSTTPLGRTGLIAGKAAAVIAVLALQVLVIGTVAAFLGWRPEPAGIPAALLMLVLGAAAFTALGLLVAGTVRPEATLAITNLLWILLAAGGGIVIPAAALPGELAAVVQVLPSGALGDALRDAMLAGDFNFFALLVLAGWTAVAGLAASRWFKWS
ncbi:ABC transporter permease [Arthrobacter sp. H14]|uniref:ABC transporter permease n=1 Tax=Arthrobacter sp. H14 TaxID=1312959 RepID=UPI00047E4457|nr:ABC transporter permease [Arthrobacter sp. H14]